MCDYSNHTCSGEIYMKHTLVITSMYANPIHPGHIECIEKCTDLGDTLWVIINNDQQQVLKTGKIFQNEEFRLKIVESIKCVDRAILSIDNDPTVCRTIENIYYTWKDWFDEFIFAKGGDRNAGNIPEKEICDKLGIKIVDGLGDKIYSSSDYRDKVV